ncbi:Barstar, RNAse (barnase) inhibitor [Candidatus Pantoea deserta]|uniref:Barstar, RNAse (Barnase) inhibitor n=1 Tax=Candidatus Pantoea deserta TaxID=1869313 RepID=A0A3N4P9B0_9GAMM|nr:barstar family protein [Pantoea deserta]RPD96073.1 Barstar, RNAse (barnase) inhibitor [Pantoea deserta]
MLTITLDFHRLTDRHALYQTLAQQSHCPFAFGNNLDALWDWLTGGMALPARIRLRHAAELHNSDEFGAVLALLEEAAQALEGDLRLTWD